MNLKGLLLLSAVAVLILLSALFVSLIPVSQQSGPLGFFALENQPFEQRRTKLLNELSDSINQAMLEGKYHCCIEPPCTMCYLGNWIWEDGTCECDAMIAKGEFDKVCPQCKKGIEEGKCTSTVEESCEVPKGLFE